MRIALYCRVSTADQNCEMQLRELRAYAAARNWPIVAEYTDSGWSGAKAARPELNQLMADARTRRFDVVCVWKLDRWGRSVADSIKGIQELVSLGIRFIAVTQDIDTDESNPMARFLPHIMAAFAELEREMIRERVAAGLKNAKARGTRIGRPRRVFDRQRALEMRDQGMSYPVIARALEVGYGTVVRGIGSLSKTRDAERVTTA